MASLVTPAILLRSIDYGEADRVVTLLGRVTGRASALARGARRSQKRFGAGLGLCAIGEAALRERQGAELMSLERFDVRVSFASFSTDVARMAHAAYAAEVTSKLCAPRQAEPAVYDWLEEFLARLDAGGATAERLRVFELGLLRRLGTGPAIDACLACGRAIRETEETRWDAGRGGTVCMDCGRRGRPMRPMVRAALARLASLSLEAADAERLAPDVNAACRDAILEIVRTAVPGPLRSLEFIAKLSGGAMGSGAAGGGEGRS